MGGARLAIAIAIALAFAGCGHDDHLGCGTVQPCGGDLVGTWRLATLCAAQTPVPADLCAAATVVSSSYQVTGTATYDADLSYSVDATESATIEVSVPGSCLVFNGATVSCAQITPRTAVDVDVRCVEANDGCLCTFVLLGRSRGEKGTYVTSGSIVTDSPSQFDKVPLGYCVDGQVLHIITLDATMTTVSGRPVIASDLVGVKQ
jgi:hypothetical protein